MWLICERIPTIGIRARLKIWSYACPGEATLLAPRSGRPSLGGATRWRWRTCRRRRGGGRLPFGEATWRGRQAVVVVKAVDEDDRWWERWCRDAVPEVSWRSSSGRVCVKESWACKFAHRVSVESMSRCCVQVFVSVTVCYSWSVVVYVSRREDQVQVWGGGKPVKGSLFNEDLSLYEAGVDGVVHEVVGMYYARVDCVFHGC
jgi:hypothetical protein